MKYCKGTCIAKPDSQHISPESAMGSDTFGSTEEIQSDQRLQIKYLWCGLLVVVWNQRASLHDSGIPGLVYYISS